MSRITLRLMIAIVALVLVPLATAMAQSPPAPLPHPQVLELEEAPILLAASGEPLLVNWPIPMEGAIRQAHALLERRLDVLGGHLSRTMDIPDVQIWIVPAKDLGLPDGLATGQIEQAYSIRIKQAETAPTIMVEAETPLGLYYGTNTLSQLLTAGPNGEVMAPEGRIIDYPDIPLRLGKSSASYTTLSANERLNQWLALMKISHLGLQYHGKHSKDPEPPFEETISTIGERNRREGIIKTIVYFCPYRGEYVEAEDRWTSYDMQREEDRQQYADYIRWLMKQGAHGIEVDYNDWPGSREVPIEDILTLATEAATEVDPNAEILYCPPLYGDQLYYGPASATLARTLQHAPDRVRALWTGVTVLIEEPLPAAALVQWASTTGERPVLWVNRVSPTAPKPFVTETADGTGVFQGEFLPANLADLVAGVHLNLHGPHKFEEEQDRYPVDEMVYLATVADYLWNPDAWEAGASAKRAREWMKTMAPLVRGE